MSIKLPAIQKKHNSVMSIKNNFNQKNYGLNKEKSIFSLQSDLIDMSNMKKAEKYNSFKRSVEVMKRSSSYARDCLFNYKLFNPSLNLSKKFDFMNQILKENQRVYLDDIKEEQEFVNHLINNYISKPKIKEQKLFFNKIKKDTRVIFIILDGTFIQSNSVKGFYTEIPVQKVLKKYPKNKRTEIYENLCTQANEFFHYKLPLTYLFTHELKFIFDLIDLNDNDKYLIVSHKISCTGAKIIPGQNFNKLYKSNTFKKKSNCITSKIDDNTQKLPDFFYKANNYMKNFKIKRIKPILNNTNHSFTQDDGSKNEEFIYYSEDEKKNVTKIDDIIISTKSRYNYIMNNIDLKVDDQILEKKSKIKCKVRKDLFEDFLKYKSNYIKVLHKYQKEVTGKNINLFEEKENVLTGKEMKESLKIANFLKGKNINDTNTKINDKKINQFIQNKQSRSEVYHNLSNKIMSVFPIFFLNNISHLEFQYTDFTRQDLYDLYATYKTMLTFSYCIYKNKLILKNGVDFVTFWKSLDEFKNENENFAHILFCQFNSSKSGLLTFKEFLNGMSYLRSSNMNEKFALFLNALDKTGKGEFTYKEILQICSDTLSRNLVKGSNSISKHNNTIIDGLSLFFANFIFKLMNKSTDFPINFDEIKESVKDNVKNREYFNLLFGIN